MSRFVLAMVVFAVSSCLAGCHVLDTPYEPAFHNTSWDPVFGACGTCGVCGGDCVGHTPGSYIGHQIRCANGCGQIYWGEWFSDPPDECDPCDDCGNWVGQRCCPPTWKQHLVAGVRGGYHACDACGGKGCDACGPVGVGVVQKGVMQKGGIIQKGEVFEDSTVIQKGGVIQKAQGPFQTDDYVLPLKPAATEEAARPPVKQASFKLPFQVHSTRLAR